MIDGMDDGLPLCWALGVIIGKSGLLQLAFRFCCIT